MAGRFGRAGCDRHRRSSAPVGATARRQRLLRARGRKPLRHQFSCGTRNRRNITGEGNCAVAFECNVTDSDKSTDDRDL